MNASVVRGDSDVAAGEGRDEGDADGGIILQARGTKNEAVERADVGIRGENFDVWPVGAENGAEGAVGVVRDIAKGKFFECW